MPTTVFNVTERPIRYTGGGNRVPGRSSAVVDDTSDKYYLAALERGELVVLSDSVVTPAPVPVTEPEPTPIPESETEVSSVDETETVADDQGAENKKKPSKAKEN